MGITQGKFLDIFKYFKGEPQQIEGVKLLYADLVKEESNTIGENPQWLSKYTEVQKPKGILLNIPYQSQLDNASGMGYRECFSSTCAMIAMYWKKITNDDAYNRVRAKYGDTTSAEAQLAALRSLGLKAEFRTDGTPAVLERELANGRPVGVGWLHKGTVTAPSGGGHWSCVIGVTASAWIMNDPNGEALLIQGGYSANTNGTALAYSKKNWNPRWMPGGTGGWYLTVRP